MDRVLYARKRTQEQQKTNSTNKSSSDPRPQPGGPEGPRREGRDVLAAPTTIIIAISIIISVIININYCYYCQIINSNDNNNNNNNNNNNSKLIIIITIGRTCATSSATRGSSLPCRRSAPRTRLYLFVRSFDDRMSKSPPGAGELASVRKTQSQHNNWHQCAKLSHNTGRGYIMRTYVYVYIYIYIYNNPLYDMCVYIYIHTLLLPT